MALKKKTEKNNKKRTPSFWSRLSDDRKSTLLKYAGWTVAAFAVFISLNTFISNFGIRSYVYKPFFSCSTSYNWV